MVKKNNLFQQRAKVLLTVLARVDDWIQEGALLNRVRARQKKWTPAAQKALLGGLVRSSDINVKKDEALGRGRFYQITRRGRRTLEEFQNAE